MHSLQRNNAIPPTKFLHSYCQKERQYTQKNTKKIVGGYQCGFSPHRCTIDQIFTDFKRALDKEFRMNPEETSQPHGYDDVR